MLEKDTVTATFEEPIPLLGLHAQQLGSVERCRLTLDTRRIVQLELRTDWQTLQVRGDAVIYDEKEKVFRLLRRGRTTPPRIVPRDDQAPSESSESSSS